MENDVGHVAVNGSKLVVSGVRKGFATGKGRLDVVGGVSFAVEEGRTLAIVGPSGCGKSTLMNMVAGFLAPDQGEVQVDGRPRNGPCPRGIMISQLGSVFPWLTVQQNLMFGLHRGTRKERIELADHYTAMVGLTGFENAYPRQLSGGMLKRVE